MRKTRTKKKIKRRKTSKYLHKPKLNNRYSKSNSKRNSKRYILKGGSVEMPHEIDVLTHNYNSLNELIVNLPETDDTIEIINTLLKDNYTPEELKTLSLKLDDLIKPKSQLKSTEFRSDEEQTIEYIKRLLDYNDNIIQFYKIMSDMETLENNLYEALMANKPKNIFEGMLTIYLYFFSITRVKDIIKCLDNLIDHAVHLGIHVKTNKDMKEKIFDFVNKALSKTYFMTRKNENYKEKYNILIGLDKSFLDDSGLAKPDLTINPLTKLSINLEKNNSVIKNELISVLKRKKYEFKKYYHSIEDMLSLDQRDKVDHVGDIMEHISEE
jgi:hypothetical protein